MRANYHVGCRKLLRAFSGAFGVKSKAVGVRGAFQTATAVTLTLSLMADRAAAALSTAGAASPALAGRSVMAPRELLFLDPSAPKADWIKAHLRASVDVIELDPRRDGVEQITEILAGRSDIAAIHIVSHGSEARIRLGNVWLGQDNIRAYRRQLRKWSAGKPAEILLYSCDTARGDDGLEFVRQLESLTRSPIAASDDATGSAVLGGDWKFEVGQPAAGLAITEAGREGFDAVLGTFVVTNSLDSGAGSLRQAVLDGNADTNGPAIVTFAPELNNSTITVTNGQIPITASMKILGIGPEALTISGNSNSRIFEIYSPIDVTISGLTLSKGAADQGGAIKNSDGTLLLTNCVLTANRSTAKGGALWADGFFLDLRVIDCVFSSNQSGSDGGGVYVEDTGAPTLFQRCLFTNNVAGGDGGGAYFYDPDRDVTLDQCVFSGNKSFDNGGGVYLYSNDAGVFRLLNCRFEGNTAAGGGGAYLYAPDLGLVVSNCVFSANSATNGFGGGLGLARYIAGGLIEDSVFSSNQASAEGGGLGARNSTGGDTLTISRCLFENNQATNSLGGGFFVSNVDSVKIRNSTFIQNEASQGGGLFASPIFNGQVVQSTFSGNRAKNNGGGILGNGISIFNSTIAENSAPAAAGITNTSLAPMQLVSSIVALNSAQTNGSLNGAFDAKFNLIDSLPAGASLITSLSNIIGVAPGLNLPIEVNNPAGLPTYTLSTNSPAQNKGTNVVALPTDQRSLPRVANGAIDIGATELQRAPDPVSVTIASSINPANFGQSITFTARVDSVWGTVFDGTSVSFLDGPNLIASSPISSQVAVLTTSSLPAGNRSITAAFPNTPYLVGAASPVLIQVVNQAGTTAGTTTGTTTGSSGATTASTGGTSGGGASAGGSSSGSSTGAGGTAGGCSTNALPLLASWKIELKRPKDTKPVKFRAGKSGLGSVRGKVSETGLPKKFKGVVVEIALMTSNNVTAFGTNPCATVIPWEEAKSGKASGKGSLNFRASKFAKDEEGLESGDSFELWIRASTNFGLASSITNKTGLTLKGSKSTE